MLCAAESMGLGSTLLNLYNLSPACMYFEQGTMSLGFQALVPEYSDPKPFRHVSISSNIRYMVHRAKFISLLLRCLFCLRPLVWSTL